MSNLKVYEKIYIHLFESKEETKLTEAEQRVKDRCLAIYTKKLDDPLISDKDLVSLITKQFDVSKSQAYYDISNVERLFGNFRRANKEYIRHLVTETQKEIIKKELERLKADPEYKTRNLSYAVRVLALANNLHHEDPDTPDWGAIQPPIAEVNDDITILDLGDVKDDHIEKLRAAYMNIIKKEATDVEEIIENSE